MTPTTDDDPTAPETGAERFTEYAVRHDPATDTALVNITTAPRDAWDEYIGRGNPAHTVEKSEWANPYRIGDDGDRETVVEKYRDWLADYLYDSEHSEQRRDRLLDLHGKTLACWCVGQTDGHTPCHGDVLMDAIAVCHASDRAVEHLSEAVRAMQSQADAARGGE